ncbi:hypothetical protein [Nocardia wallacei]|uniref:hypothetical protein n=1 Tax=Nocardia wallacei TaxID=480035 RepID=UPI002458DF00|nr:hypothetical protein [Nocardia wallacei]
MADEIEVETSATTTLIPIIGAAPLIVRHVSEKPKRHNAQSQHGPTPVREVRIGPFGFGSVAVDHDNHMHIDDTEVPR